MKKLLFAFPIVALLAAGCNSNQLAPQQQNRQTSQVPSSDAVPSPNTQTTNKLYINNRVGYQFEYPADGLKLPLDETIKYPDPNNPYKDLVQFATPQRAYSVQTYVGAMKSFKSLADWIADAIGTDTNISHYSKANIGGQEAYLYNDSAITYIGYNGNVYEIIARSGIAPIPNDNEPTYNLILNTLKFADPLTDKTANWKTYTNSHFLYSIKYPQNWKIDTQRSSENEIVFDNGVLEAHISVDVQPYSKTLTDWKNSLDKSVITSVTDTTVANLPALRVKTGEMGGDFVGMIFNGYLYRFDSINDDMLKTFQFIKQFPSPL
jgi:hypothetical protein